MKIQLQDHRNTGKFFFVCLNERKKNQPIYEIELSFVCLCVKEKMYGNKAHETRVTFGSIVQFKLVAFATDIIMQKDIRQHLNLTAFNPNLTERSKIRSGNDRTRKKDYFFLIFC